MNAKVWLERRLATDEDLDPHLITFRFSVSPRDAVQLAGGGRQELGEFALRHKWQETQKVLNDTRFKIR